LPKLNRIRIINFYYNNDIRQIADETFSFYGGENALLNLANGGGKSVLIQLMLQPIIPDYTMQKRTMSSFFKKSTYPAYVLLEWILDNQSKNDYLMTGIAIAPKINKDESLENSLNFFTFASHYSQVCEFDLGYVPFAKREAGRQMIMPFEKARETVRNLANSNSEVFYYSKDDRVDYGRKLSEFRISQEEWKNIIARMNNDEGGIDELFDKCSTSDKLVDEWIIKTVEKAVMSNGTENARLYELMEWLVRDTIKNEQYIKDEKILKVYLQEHEVLEKSLGSVCAKIDVRDKAENDLCHLYSLLIIELGHMEGSIAELDLQRQDLEDQLSLITKEEESQKYYHCLKAKEEAMEEERINTANAEALKERISCLIQGISIQRAAKYYDKYQKLQGEIQGIVLRLNAEQGDASQAGERINQLKYSIKVFYDRQIKESRKSLDKLICKGRELKQKEADAEKKLTGFQKKHNEISIRLGELNTSITDFELYEESVCHKLSITLNRNLLGVLEGEETEKIRKQLAQAVAASKEKLEQIQQRLLKIKEKIAANQILKESLIKEIADLEHRYEEAGKDREDYLVQENVCRNLLFKYDISEGLLFSSEELSRKIKQLIKEREQWRVASEIELNQLGEMITGIKEGQIYVPKALSALLDQEKIPFQTGEKYLNEFNDQKKSALLKKNSLLPFSIIVEEKYLEKMKKIQFKEVFLCKLIPLFTYEDLRKKYKQENDIINVGDTFKMISSYEPKLFYSKEKAEYIADLEASRYEIEKKAEGIREEISALEESRNILSRFQFEHDYKERLDKKLQSLKELISEKNIQMTKTDEENIQLFKEQEEKNELYESTRRLAEEQNINITLFAEYLEKDKDYMVNRTSKSGLLADKEKTDKLESDEKKLYKGYIEEENILEMKKFTLTNTLKTSKENYAVYEDTREVEAIEAPIGNLEKEYEKLSSSFKHSIQEMEDAVADKKKLVQECQDEINDLNLALNQYKDIPYDEVKAELLKNQRTEAEEIYEKEENIRSKSHDDAVKAAVNFENAVKRLAEQGMDEPLPMEDIKQNYVNRRKAIRFDISKIREEQKSLQERKNLCETRTGILNNLIMPDSQKSANSSFSLEEDIKIQCEALEHKYREAGKDCKAGKERFVKAYKEISSRYDNVHNSITDILNSLNSLINMDNSNGITYDKIYFYVEELTKKRETLEKLLDLYRQKLAVVEDTKRQVITQCISYASLIYEGIKAISEKSKVKLTGKARSNQMLRIGVPNEIDVNAQSRMKEYIEITLNTLVTYLNDTENTKDRKYKDKIRNMISTRFLINQLLGKNHIPVSIYKIELNEKNNGMKSWEDAMRENSGGEKFVCFFTVASTLISYTREVTGNQLAKEFIDGRAMNESKVMIMDNPFARTSSEHLLKAVIDIARTFNIQLICLSDLSQSSITNRFNLIFALSVRQRMYSDREVLYVEKPLLNGIGLREDEGLEHVTLHQTYNQVSLFDGMDI
jgi:hypothetical protein